MNRKTRTTTTPLALFASLVGLLAGAARPAAAGAGDRPLFTLSDPRGDDHGDGALLYPSRPEIERGDLDLLELAARAAGGGTWFEAVFARPVRLAARRTVGTTGEQLDDIARLGFYTFNLDLYIDIDRQPGSGAVSSLPGRNAEIAAASAWERAIILTPRPHAARGALKRLMMKDLREALRDEEELSADQAESLRLQIPEEVEGRVFFPTQVRVSGQRVRFFVPDAFLGGPARPDWGYAVAVSGSDLVRQLEQGGLVRSDEQEALAVLAREEGYRAFTFGGARPDDTLQTPLVDILVPSGASQEAVLLDYDRRDQRPVRLPGVVPADPTAGASPGEAIGSASL